MSQLVGLSVAPVSRLGLSALRARTLLRSITFAFLGLGLLGSTLSLGLFLGPAIGTFQGFVITTDSMTPSITAGSLVVVQTIDAASTQVGDVIVFARPGRAGEFIAHRVHAIDQDASGTALFVTKGDANADVDGWRLSASGTGSRVFLALPGVGSALLAAQTPLGRLSLVVLPILGLAAIALIEIVWPRPRATRAAH